jgi:hypothetical protein
MNPENRPPTRGDTQLAAGRSRAGEQAASDARPTPVSRQTKPILAEEASALMKDD